MYSFVYRILCIDALCLGNLVDPVDPSIGRSVLFSILFLSYFLLCTLVKKIYLQVQLRWEPVTQAYILNIQSNTIIVKCKHILIQKKQLSYLNVTQLSD